MISYYINSKRIYIDENDYSIIFINKSTIGAINGNGEYKGGSGSGGNGEYKGGGNLVYTIDNSYYNFSIKPTQLEESMIVFK
jgi:hypothetical protein